jgi:hypothetical protein
MALACQCACRRGNAEPFELAIGHDQAQAGGQNRAPIGFARFWRLGPPELSRTGEGRKSRSYGRFATLSCALALSARAIRANVPDLLPQDPDLHRFLRYNISSSRLEYLTWRWVNFQPAILVSFVPALTVRSDLWSRSQICLLEAC